MMRYGYELRDCDWLEGEDEIFDTTEEVVSADVRIHRDYMYVVFDRFRGLNIAIARCDSRDDAEKIVAALNASVAETTTKPSNDSADEQRIWDALNTARQNREEYAA